MAIDYDKLANMDTTAYENAKQFREKIVGEIPGPQIFTENYFEDGIPVVKAIAEDFKGNELYSEVYKLDEVSAEEALEVMFGIYDDVFDEVQTELEIM